IVSPIASGAGHIAGGTTANLITGQNLGDAFGNSFKGIGQSMAIGIAIGVSTTIGVSYANNVSPWTGRSLVSVTASDLGLTSTMDRINARESYPHERDNTVFENRIPKGADAPLLPEKPLGYYREYVHPTPGINGPGPQRVIIGGEKYYYYSPDHYKTFIRFR
ncbi:MAG: hypothetical protein LBH37_01310, partial [Oscillospiraceae bacterium]|nr:hypothetical protein [Oscillospiraceae bacterium]